MALNMKSKAIRTETLIKGTKEDSLTEGATIVESMGTRSLIAGTWKINKRIVKRMKERFRKTNLMSEVSNIKAGTLFQRV